MTFATSCRENAFRTHARMRGSRACSLAHPGEPSDRMMTVGELHRRDLVAVHWSALRRRGSGHPGLARSEVGRRWAFSLGSHEAARIARTDAGPDAAARAAAFEVEIHKKFALAAACMVLALAGAAIALRFPRGGPGLVIGASGVVFTGYYVTLVAGESLADRLVIAPFVAMWMANAFLLAIFLLLVRRPGRPRAAGGAESLAIDG